MDSWRQEKTNLWQRIFLVLIGELWCDSSGPMLGLELKCGFR
jgi:hypothetical protein